MAPAALLPVKAALVDVVLPAVLPGWSVSWGKPVGLATGGDLVAVLDGRSDVDVVQQSMLRPEDETLHLEILFSCFRSGGAEAQRAATVAAFGGLDALRARLKTPGQEQLGTTIRWARLDGYALTEDDPDDPGSEDDLTSGRLAQITAQVRILART